MIDFRRAEPNGVLTAFRTSRCLLFGFLYGDFLLLRLCDDSPIHMSGKSGKPGTPSDVFGASRAFLASMVISLIELLYKFGWSLCNGGMTKDVSHNLVTGLGPTVRVDVAWANSSSREAHFRQLLLPPLALPPPSLLSNSIPFYTENRLLLG